MAMAPTMIASRLPAWTNAAPLVLATLVLEAEAEVREAEEEEDAEEEWLVLDEDEEDEEEDEVFEEVEVPVDEEVVPEEVVPDVVAVVADEVVAVWVAPVIVKELEKLGLPGLLSSTISKLYAPVLTVSGIVKVAVPEEACTPAAMVVRSKQRYRTDNSQTKRSPVPGWIFSPCVKRIVTVPDEGLAHVIVIDRPATTSKPPSGVLIWLFCCARAMAAQRAKINPKSRIL